MDLRIGPTGRRGAEQPPPAPQLQWARVCELDGPVAAGAKAAAAAGGTAPCVFAAGRSGVRRWLASGRSEAFLPAEAAPVGVHALAVVPSAGSLFCCAADGNVTCFDLQSGAKQRVLSAHIGEVVCATSWVDPRTSAAFVATGGVDFQVKTWGPDGCALGASGHHHGRVNCLLAMPPPAASLRPLQQASSSSVSCAAQPSAPANTRCASGCGSRQASLRQLGMAGHPARGSVGGSRHSSLAPGDQAGVGPVGPGPLLVSGCTDGSVFVWEDRASTGLLSEAEGVWLRHPLQKGVTSLLGVDGSIWAGCADGHIVVWQPAPGGGFAFQRALNPHTDQVSCLLLVGRQVWSGSADRSICASDAASGEILFRIPDQGGYIKALVPFGWTVWAFTSKGISVLASEASWLAAQERGGALELAASAAEVQRLAAAVQEREAEVCRLLEECEAASEREASAVSALAAERAQHEAALASCRAQHHKDLEAQRAQHAAEAAEAQQQWDSRLAAQHAQHGSKMSSQQAAHEASMTALQQQLAAQQAQHAEESAALRDRLEAATASHAATCATQQAEHARLTEQLEACQRQLAEAQQQVQEHGSREAAHDDLITGLKSNLERARSEGAHAVAALREEHTTQLAALAAAHNRELGALRTETEAAAAAQQAQHAKQMADAEAACAAQLAVAQRALEASNHTAAERAEGLEQELQRLRSTAAQHAQQAEAAVAMAQEEDRQVFEERLAAQQAQVAALQQQIAEQQQQAQRAAVGEQQGGRQRVLTFLDASTQAGEPGGAAGDAAESAVLLQRVMQVERERQAAVAEAAAQSEELRLLHDKVHKAQADLAAAALQREQQGSAAALAASTSRMAELEHMLREIHAQHAAAEQRTQQAQQEAARQHTKALQALQLQHRAALVLAEQQRLSAAEAAQQSQAQLEAARQRAAQEAATQAAATKQAQRELFLANEECSRLHRDCQELRQQRARAQQQDPVNVPGSGGQQQGPAHNSGAQQQGRARSGAQQQSPGRTPLEEKRSQELQSMQRKLAREAAAHAATRERIADLEGALQEAVSAYQALSVQLRTMTRQQQQLLQHPGQQESPRQQQRAQQQEQCPEPWRQQPAPPTQQAQQAALLLERLRRAEEGLQQRDACLEALQRANALLFSHAQAVGGDLRGYEAELQRAGATVQELLSQRPGPPAGQLPPSLMASTTGMVGRAVPGSPVALSPGQLQPWPLAAASRGVGHVAAVLSPGAAAGGGSSHGAAMLAPGTAAGGGSPEARVQAGRVRFLPPNGALW